MESLMVKDNTNGKTAAAKLFQIFYRQAATNKKIKYGIELFTWESGNF